MPDRSFSGAVDLSTLEIQQTRHILGLSGGKDSAALAIYLKDQGRDQKIEYFFCDTGAELKEVYDYLYRLEDYLGKPIKRLSSGRDFDHHLKRFNGFLPAAHARWCTRVMKIEPLEAFVGKRTLHQLHCDTCRRTPRWIHQPQAQHNGQVSVRGRRHRQGRRVQNPRGFGWHTGVLSMAEPVWVLFLLFPETG